MIEKDFYSKEGESTIYVGKLYLLEISAQIRNIRLSQREALLYQEEKVMSWLIELMCFYDLIENQLSLKNSDKKIKFFTYKLENQKMRKIEIEIEEKNKFLRWFDEIEQMYMRTAKMNIGEEFDNIKYKKYKEILVELSRCYRELMAEANKKHLIMPDVKVDMKELAKSDWIDREVKEKIL